MTTTATAAGRHSTYTPLPYQSDCLLDVASDWSRGFLRTVVLLPTGMGKSVIAGFVAAMHLAANPTGRVLMIAHREELVDALAEKAMATNPGRSVGVVLAERNQPSADIVCASTATLAGVARRDQVAAYGRITLIVVDECHHVMADTYLAILAHFDGLTIKGGQPATVPVLGFTATLSRGDEQALGNVWQKISFRRSIEWAIEEGWILPTREIRVKVPGFQLETLPTDFTGDYAEAALGLALTNANAGALLAEQYRKHAMGKRTVGFVPTVAAAAIIARDFNRAGIPAEVIHGGMKRRERHAVFARVRSGETLVMFNCMVLTEGFDMPEIECIILARPSKIAALKIQMEGRGRRTCPAIGKTECIVLDTVGVTRSLAGEAPVCLEKDHKPLAPAVRTTTGCEKPVQAPRRTVHRPLPAKYRATTSTRGNWWTLTVTRTVKIDGRDDVTVIDRRVLPNGADIDRAANLVIKIDQTKRIQAARKLNEAEAAKA